MNIVYLLLITYYLLVFSGHYELAIFILDRQAH